MNITLIAPADGLRFSVMNGLFREYVRAFDEKKGGPDRGVMPDFGHRDGLDYDCGYPNSLIFRWRTDDPLARPKLEISDDPSFETAALVTVDTVFAAAEGDGEYFARGTNFRMGQKYFWRVTSGDSVSETRSFETYYDRVRQIEISCIYNVRDVGGRMTDSGRRVKQGLLYRGTQPECMPEDKSALNDRGRLTMYRDLGIKTELDLRDDKIGRARHDILNEREAYLAAGPEDEVGSGAARRRRLAESDMDADIWRDAGSSRVDKCFGD